MAQLVESVSLRFIWPWQDEKSAVLLAQSRHNCAYVCASGVDHLRARCRRIRARSAWWDDVLVRTLGDGALTTGLGNHASRRNLSLGPADPCATHDRRDVARLHTIAHIIIYFALRLWDFGHIAHEMVTRSAFPWFESYQAASAITDRDIDPDDDILLLQQLRELVNLTPLDTGVTEHPHIHAAALRITRPKASPQHH